MNRRHCFHYRRRLSAERSVCSSHHRHRHKLLASEPKREWELKTNVGWCARASLAYLSLNTSYKL
ncbi:MAG TPA: hypothetical protein DEX20_00680, partial [Halieaceae bacterium]|nr:hypothetical protein [Halieaceae bacterium]